MDHPLPTSNTPDEQDLVVLVDETGNPIGTQHRLSVHTDDTPLHLAFSVYLFDSEGRVLMTRRAWTKLTWPSVLTNSCCGHPKPGEDFESAITRRVAEELGLAVESVRVALPDFRYRARDASGLVENEICPVFVGFVRDTTPQPNPDEVAEYAWVTWADLAAAAQAVPCELSPWSALQIPQLDRAGIVPPAN